MGEWADITITGRDKERSEQPANDDSELSRQVFTLSDMPPTIWAQICNDMLIAEPGRVGRDGKVVGQSLCVWDGPNVFAESDADHLKELVAFVNGQYRKTLAPMDLSGLDAFDL